MALLSLTCSKFVLDSTDQANSDQGWLCEEVQAVNRTIKVTNKTLKPIILGKNQETSVIKVRPVKTTSNKHSIIDLKYFSSSSSSEDYKKNEDTRTYVQRINEKHLTSQPPPSDLYIPESGNPEDNIKKIFIEPGVMDENQNSRLWSILNKYKKVFDNNISEGYNNESGEFDVDWYWLNDQQPPPGVSKQEVYANEEMNQLKQAKIDWMESENICFKAHLLGVPVKYASLTMLVPKASFKDHQGPLHHGLFRFVNLFNQLNEYIKLEPSQPESISSVLYEAGQWNYMISGDLTNSFYQRWIAKRKLPYMAFHSPYKGMYILARSAQGMKNQSEGLDQMMRVVLGELIKQGKARKIADDVQAGGRTIDEAIDNFEEVLFHLEKNNLKMDPKKTKIFAKKLPIFGWIKDGQNIKPDQHSILAIGKASKPKTITELRSYLGSYKVFYRHMPNMSMVLDDLQQLTGEKNGKTEIIWTKALDKAFIESKEALKNIKSLYLPKRSDQLAITLDWSAKGIGAALWALLENEKKIVSFFSAPLKGAQSKWPPCDGEGLAACSAIQRFSNFIRESSQPTLVCSDNKPVVQAALLLNKGIFSSSPRLNTLLGNCNTFPLTFHHLSGKLALNEESDMLSRNPMGCYEKDCPVCIHLNEQSEVLDTTMTGGRKFNKKIRHINIKNTLINEDPCCQECHTCGYLKNAGLDQELSISENLEKVIVNKLQIEDIMKGEKSFPYLEDRKTLIQVQKNDPVLIKLIQNLQSGHRPTARNTKSGDLKTYLGFNPKLDYDGLVVIERVLQPHLINLTVPILPPNFAKSIMLAAHIKLGHPKPAQLEKIIYRSFCTLKVKNLIKELFENCYTCQADLVLPKEAPVFKTETKPQCPGVYWSCDVMKHGRKNIMVCTDNFSSFTTCAFINSENQVDCENAIVSSIFPFKAAVGGVKIRVDTAPGLAAMVNRSSDHFKEAGFILEPGNIKNKNSLGKVDKTMAELRAILRTISTDGSSLSPIDLQKSVQILNSRIRFSNLSAREIMFSRLQTTNENIKLDDKAISEALYDKRLKANEAVTKRINKKAEIPKNLKVHSLVFLKEDISKDKTKIRDLYIVMNINQEKDELKIQKMLNPLTPLKSRINNKKQYTVKLSDVYLAPSQQKVSSSREDDENETQEITSNSDSPKSTLIPEVMSNVRFYSLEDDEEDDTLVVRTLAKSPVATHPSEGTSHSTETTKENLICDENCSEEDNTLNSPQTASYPMRLQQVSKSPITSNEHDPSFGYVNLSWDPESVQLCWDHSSDLSIPMYDDENLDDTANLVLSMLDKVLDEDDEVFKEGVEIIEPPEDATVNDDRNKVVLDTTNSEQVDDPGESQTYQGQEEAPVPVGAAAHPLRPPAGAPLNLHLRGDKVQPGRVYRLESRLPVPLDLHMRENDVMPGKVYKLKRLSSNFKEPSKETKSRKSKKKKLPVKDWFIKKITFATRKPPDDPDDNQPPGLAT